MSVKIQVDESKKSLLETTYKTHPWRWYILATLSMLGFSHGVNFLTFSSVFNYAAEFYHVSTTQINYMTIAFFIGSILGAPVGMFVLDTLSLREAMWIGGILNVLGSVIRVISAYTPHIGYYLALIAQAIIGFAQPYFLYAPPKLASVWFAENERVVSNSIASLMSIMGNGVSLLLGPGIVHSADNLPTLLIVTATFAVMSLLMTVFGVWSRKPKFPPSPSAREEVKTWPGFKQLLRKWKFWFLCVVWAIQAGITTANLALLPQFICPFGYDQFYSGVVGATMVFGGLISASILGVIIDKTKLFMEVSKVAMCIAIICSLFVMEVFRIPNQPVLVALAYVLLGIFALIQVPVFIELAIEVTYPVAVATCSGILYCAAQIVGAVMTFLAPFFGKVPHPNFGGNSKCHSESYNSTAGVARGVDYIYYYYFTVGLSVVVLIVYVFGFTSKYNRLEAERKIRRKENEGEH